MPRLKTRRGQLYAQLRQEHLTHREALEFSKMGKHRPPGSSKSAKAVYPPALRRVVQERREMWTAFDKVARDKGWGSWKQKQEWKDKIGELYGRLSKKHTGNFFVSKDVHGKEVPRRINPWALYDAKYDDLPDEDKWDTPRSHRTKQQTGVAFKAEKRYREKQLREDIRLIEQDIRQYGDSRGERESQLRSLQYNLKTGSF